MKFEERASVFTCGTDRLVAIVSRPPDPLPRGVIVVVGGPQYRVGSHRQFTLLCRALAAKGIAAMRFDYRGMGDSEGSARNFEDIQPDMRAAIDHLRIEVPEVREVIIWGLCDAASAGLLGAHLDKRVTGLVLLNPWVRTLEGLAKTQLKHYYWSRLTDLEFWRRMGRGEFDAATAVWSFAIALKTALGLRNTQDTRDGPADASVGIDVSTRASLPERMAEGMSRFKGKVLLILSGNDLTAKEFEEVVRGSNRWNRLLADARVESRRLSDANHTFSRAEWRDQVANWTADWVRSW
jgi:exosortase A-associated hydrolase 1